MTDNVIRFGKAKKALKRARDEQQAAENRVKFGRTKAEKQRDKLTDAQYKKGVDSHKRDDD